MLCSYYLVADREANCFALSVYALREGAVNVFFINVIWKNWWWNVRWCWSDNFDLMMFYCQPGWSLLRVLVNLQIREGNTVTLLEPFFHNVCVSWQGKVKISPFSSNGVLHCFQFLRSHFHILWLHLRVCLPISRAP